MANKARLLKDRSNNPLEQMMHPTGYIPSTISADVTWLRRPYGRVNSTLNDDRGWLHLERIIIAMKAAAADPASFDDIIMTSSKTLNTKLLRWSNRLRRAARKQISNPQILVEAEKKFKSELEPKKFQFTKDRKIVQELLCNLMKQFKEDWNGEVEKQKTISQRGRDIVMRWGCFSESYVEKAGFLSDEKIVQTVRFSACLFLSFSKLTIYIHTGTPHPCPHYDCIIGTNTCRCSVFDPS